MYVNTELLLLPVVVAEGRYHICQQICYWFPCGVLFSLVLPGNEHFYSAYSLL